jgi:hypothetical protein
MPMKLFTVLTMFGLVVSGTVLAEDFSVGLVNPGSGLENGGTAVNLYGITERGVKLVQTYVRRKTDYSGNPATPLTVAINPQHDFVYAVYTGPVYDKSGDSYQPILVGFKITAKGLEEAWEDEVATGGPSLAGTSISAENGYVIENTFPSGFALYVVVVNQAGQELVSDEPGTPVVVSGHINGKFYYSCRVTSPYGRSTPVAPPATSVSVFILEHDVELFTKKVAPLTTSTDPEFVASVCN